MQPSITSIDPRIKEKKMNHIRKSVSQRVFDAFNVLFMLILSVIMLYPMWYVVCASLSNGNRLVANTDMLFFPIECNLDSYFSVFKNPMILTGYQNTLIVVGGGTLLSMVLSIIGAYCLSRNNVYWNKLLIKIIIVTMFFNGGLIPTYMLVTRTLRMNDSLLALIIPQAVSTYNLIIMRNAFSGIPESLIEASRLDGASHLQLLVKVVVPLSMPIIAVMILYYGVFYWNSWFQASIYLKTRSLYPLQLILREILINSDTASMSADAASADQYSLGETIKYTVVVIATAPILVLYPFLQRYFVKGAMVGAVKE